MLEAKAKDLALLRLRADLLRYAPDVAARFGLATENAAEFETKRVRDPAAGAAGAVTNGRQPRTPTGLLSAASW